MSMAADTKGVMVTIQPARYAQNLLLVSSDQSDRNAARQEVAEWAAQRDMALPRHPRRLSLVEGDNVVGEWFVLEPQRESEPRPPFLRLVRGGSAA